MNAFRIIIPLIVLSIAPALADDGRAEFQDRQQQLRRTAEASARGTRKIAGTFHMSDLCRLREDNKRRWVLVSRVPEQASNGTVRLDVAGMDGITTLSVSGVREGEPTPDVFALTCARHSDPRCLQITTQVVWNFGSLTLGRYAQLADGYENVTLRQGDSSDDDSQSERSGIQFTVQSSDRLNGETISLRGSAPDFASLRRDYPKEVDRYVRPLLRDLQLESIMAADPMIAWRVFVDDLRPDPTIERRVRDVLPLLDSDSFQQQSNALRELGGLGLPMAIAVARMDRTKLSVQQNVLLDAATAPFDPAYRINVASLKKDVDFLLDCLYLGDEAIRSAALARLRAASGKEIAFDPAADPVQRAKRIDALRRELHSGDSSR